MYLKNAWYVAAWSHQIGQHLVQRWVTGEPIVLYRTNDGEAVALEDRCPHRRFALSKGKLDGDAIECSYHGLTFDRTGACVRIPGQQNIPPRLKARRYPLIERWQWVWIWMGDPEKADPDRKVFDINADAGAVAARRIMQSLIAAEQASETT